MNIEGAVEGAIEATVEATVEAATGEAANGEKSINAGGKYLKTKNRLPIEMAMAMAMAMTEKRGPMKELAKSASLTVR